MGDDEFLSTEQLAELLHTVPSSIRYKRHNGTGPPGFSVGRRVLYRRSAVSEWLAAKEAAETSSPAA